MSYGFNVFTGNFDLLGSGGSSTGEGFPRYYIFVYETFTVLDGRENICTGTQTVDGVLIVEGRNTIL